MALPVFISDERVIPELIAIMKKAGYAIHQVGDVRFTTEATEQNWKCSDDIGNLFDFGTCKLTENNGLRLKGGTFCIIPGPCARGRKRKEISGACKSFEVALATLGAQQMSRK